MDIVSSGLAKGSTIDQNWMSMVITQIFSHFKNFYSFMLATHDKLDFYLQISKSLITIIGKCRRNIVVVPIEKTPELICLEQLKG